MIDRNAKAITVATALMILITCMLIGTRSPLRSANFYYPVTAPIKQWYDSHGAPLSNGYIYFGVANTNPQASPIQMYWDAAGTIKANQPFRTSGGYVYRQGSPANVYAAGDFSVSVYTSAGTLVYTQPTSVDLQLALSIAGASSAAAIPIADAGNYYAVDNVEAALQQVGPLILQMVTALAGTAPTGATIDYAGATAPAGWVLADGLTIGDGSSGGTERANADTVSLYTLEWNAYANAQLAIQDSSGTPTTRGVSASNDFAAHKRLSLPDCRGRIRVTKDNLGGTTASRLTSAGSGIDGTVMGNAGGTENTTLSTAQLPSHTHTLTDPGHTHIFSGISHNHTYVQSNNNNFAAGGGGSASNSGNTTQNSSSTTAGGTNSTTVTNITIASTGSGSAHAIVQPTIIFTAIIKL